MALTDTTIRKAKLGPKPWKLADEKGLYLLVNPNGSKLWRFKFRVNGREKKLALGAYPDLSLKAARKKRDLARERLESGADPAQEKRAARIAARIGAANSFNAVAEEFLDKMEKEGRAEPTMVKARWFLALLKPALGTRPIAEISPHELLAVLKKIEKEGKRETARRLRSFASRVFRYAVATARASHDPAQPLLGALIAPLTTHHAAITDDKALGALLRAIDGYTSQPSTIFALRLTPHIFQRPGEVRQMKWADVDFDKAVWTIPAEIMKMRQPHHVPLSCQALAILRQAQELSGDGIYVFPAIGAKGRPLSENTVNAALRRLGYSGTEMTAHGFRSTASSLLNESGLWNPDAIERALSHRESNQVRAAYHRSTYWEERVRMAQWWSDYLDGLRKGARIIPFEAAGAA